MPAQRIVQSQAALPVDPPRGSESARPEIVFALIHQLDGAAFNRRMVLVEGIRFPFPWHAVFSGLGRGAAVLIHSI